MDHGLTPATVLVLADAEHLPARLAALGARDLHAGVTAAVTVSSLAQLAAALATQRISVALIDAALGWVDPLTVLGQIQAAQPWCGLVLAVAADQDALVAEAFEAGLDAYVIGEDGSGCQLAFAIRMACQRRRLRQDNDAAWLAQPASLALREVLLDSASIGMTVVDTHFRYLWINETLAAQNGQPVAAHLGRPVREVLPHLAPVVEPFFQQVLQSKQPITNIEVVEPDGNGAGTGRVWNASYYPLAPSGGTLGGIGIVANDVTAQHRATQALVAADAQYQYLFEHHPLPMWVFDSTTLAFLAVNDAALQQYGYTRAEFLAMTIADIRPSEDLPALLEAVQGHSTGLYGEKIWRHRRKDGTLLLVEVRSYRLSFHNRPAALVQVNDVTERQQLKDQLLHAQRIESVGRLAGSVAHDFNNMLMAILGFAELALADVMPGSDAAGNLEEIHTTTLRATRLARQLLTVARRQPHAPQVLALNDLVRKLMAVLQQLLGPMIALELKLAADLWPVFADAGQIEQVLMNLAVNARDAMPEGGILTITSTNIADSATPNVGNRVRLTVQDSGIGMDAEVLAHVFEPFFTTKEPGKGTGLGLATCYGIMQSHGGSIVIQSAPNQGTNVHIELPAYVN